MNVLSWGRNICGKNISFCLLRRPWQYSPQCGALSITRTALHVLACHETLTESLFCPVSIISAAHAGAHMGGPCHFQLALPLLVTVGTMQDHHCDLVPELHQGYNLGKACSDGKCPAPYIFSETIFEKQNGWVNPVNRKSLALAEPFPMLPEPNAQFSMAIAIEHA